MTQKINRVQRKQGLLAKLLSSMSFMVAEETKAVDQRTYPRIECRAEVSFVDERGMKGSGLLIDISKSGLQIRTKTKLRRGLTLALNAPAEDALERTAPFMATVRWTRKEPTGVFRAGLVLPSGVEEDPHWLESLLHLLGYTETGGQSSRLVPSDSKLTGILFPSNDKENGTSISVLDLGIGGALIRASTSLPKDLEFHLIIGPYQNLAAVEVEGTILKVREKPGEGYTLHSVRFAAKEGRDTGILKEYVQNMSASDRPGKASIE